ncbi:hypothetical protein ACTA71_003140 [Dictyostelium dimigraforme]
MGTVNYCKDFIRNLASIAHPLYTSSPERAYHSFGIKISSFKNGNIPIINKDINKENNNQSDNSNNKENNNQSNDDNMRNRTPPSSPTGVGPVFHLAPLHFQ